MTAFEYKLLRIIVLHLATMMKMMAALHPNVEEAFLMSDHAEEMMQLWNVVANNSGMAREDR